VPTAFTVFFFFWILFGIATWVFYSKASYETKKSAHPWMMIGGGLVFLLFAEFSSSWKLPVIFPLFLVLIVFLNIRNIRFCPRCGATQQSGLSRPKFCSKCGADLNEESLLPPRNQQY
jgi:hypothetical protein